MKGSWRTSSLGLITIIQAVLGALAAIMDGNPATTFSWEITGPSISAGIALMMARDNKVSSEEAGAANDKKP